MTAVNRVCVVGAAGRMGGHLVRLIASDPAFKLSGALERQGAEGDAGERAGAGHLGVPIVHQPQAAFANAQVVVDFSAPAACAALAPLCARHKVAYLVASTGLVARDHEALREAAASIAVLQAANLSIGVNLLAELVELATARLGDGFDVEISELHHRHKKDAPSGTALLLADAVRSVRAAVRNVQRSGVGERKPDEVGLAALRGGEVAGEHTVYFLGAAERLELSHRASSPEIFAAGALRAAAWLASRPAGLYSMRDVLRGG